MTPLLGNSFELPTDGWYQISTLGEFPHNSTGLLQIIDEESCRAMVDHFTKLSATPNFPGVLIDFDHFSLDQNKPSEAAGWITRLEYRPNGLWAQIRWSDRGEESVRGGRYRFISPVWRQDECMDLGNKRVRPMRLINAAVTNDPNISGMVPLSNQREKQQYLFLSNRTELHFRRGYWLANAGVYFDPKTGQTREWEGGRPWGHGGGGGGGGVGGGVGGGSRGSGQSSQPKPSVQPTFTPKRDSNARIAELERQRAAWDAQHTAPPIRPDFSITNIRDLRNELFHQGHTINEVNAAVREAEAENDRRKIALHDIRKNIADKYSDPHRRKQELAKFLDGLNRAHDKDVKTWQTKQEQIDRKIQAVDAAINTERITSQENERYAETRSQNEEARQAERQQVQQARELRQQIAADVAAARQRAAEERAAQRANVDPATAYRQELNRRRTYWQAASRGDWESAKQIYPNADHDQNRHDLEKLVPPSHSKTNTKAYENAIKQLQYEAP